MINLAREPLRGEVEVDEYLGGRNSGRFAGKPATQRPKGGTGGGGRGARPHHRARSYSGHPGFQKHNSARLPETECRTRCYDLYRWPMA